MNSKDITIDYILEKYKHRTFYLYHIKGKKWGCTINLKRRLKEQKYTIKDTEEVKEVIGIQVADRLEKFLNERDGYPYNHTQSYILRLLARNKSAQTKKKKYTKPSNTNRKSKLSNRHKKNISRGLEKAYFEGRRTKADKSFMQTDEYKKKMSNSFKNVWKTEKDKMMKSRARGSNNGVSVLSEDSVKYIKLNYPTLSYRKLAKELNVSVKTIWNVVKGNTWKHI